MVEDARREVVNAFQQLLRQTDQSGMNSTNQVMSAMQELFGTSRSDTSQVTTRLEQLTVEELRALLANEILVHSLRLKAKKLKQAICPREPTEQEQKKQRSATNDEHMFRVPQVMVSLGQEQPAPALPGPAALPDGLPAHADGLPAHADGLPAHADDYEQLKEMAACLTQQVLNQETELSAAKQQNLVYEAQLVVARGEAEHATWARGQTEQAAATRSANVMLQTVLKSQEELHRIKEAAGNAPTKAHVKLCSNLKDHMVRIKDFFTTEFIAHKESEGFTHWMRRWADVHQGVSMDVMELERKLRDQEAARTPDMDEHQLQQQLASLSLQNRIEEEAFKLEHLRKQRATSAMRDDMDAITAVSATARHVRSVYAHSFQETWKAGGQLAQLLLPPPPPPHTPSRPSSGPAGPAGPSAGAGGDAGGAGGAGGAGNGSRGISGHENWVNYSWMHNHSEGLDNYDRVLSDSGSDA